MVLETNASGAVITGSRERMTAYGEPADGGYADGPGYTGHVTDAASKLTYMQQRYYDPMVGRFLSVDPMASDTITGWNFNRYNYAANNPHKFKDPDGRARTCVDGVCKLTADTHDPSRSSGATIVVDSTTRDAAERTKWKAKANGDTEPSYFLVRRKDGSVGSHTPTNAETTVRRERGGTAVSATRPDNAVARVHGHNKDGARASNGLVDDPTLNRGYGDFQSLTDGLPNAAVYDGNIGWNEMEAGQLIFTYPEGSMTAPQEALKQQYMDVAQELFQ